MEPDPKLLEILICPVTKGPLTYDRERQEQAFVLRGEHQEHHEDAQAEDQRGGAAAFDLVERETGPGEAGARREMCLRFVLHRGDRGAGAHAGLGLAVDFDRARARCKQAADYAQQRGLSAT